MGATTSKVIRAARIPRKFVRYNANKALMDSRYEGLFPEADMKPAVMSGVRR